MADTSTDLILSRHALTTLGAARAYLQRGQAIGEDAAIVDAVNEATALMESITQRDLRERLFVNPQSFSCTAAADSLTLTGAGLAVLKVGADAVGSTLRAESQIASVAGNGLSVTLTQPATSAGTASIEFGSAPLVQQWPEAGPQIALDQFPVEAVYSLNAIESDGTKTAIDLTGAMLRKSSGILVLANERPARGQWVEIEAKAGYREPSGADRGHAEEWRNLRRICHRIAQILFQDYRHELGRSLEVQIRDQLVRFSDLSLPKDVIAALGPFMREEV